MYSYNDKNSSHITGMRRPLGQIHEWISVMHSKAFADYVCMNEKLERDVEQFITLLYDKGQSSSQMHGSIKRYAEGVAKQLAQTQQGMRSSVEYAQNKSDGFLAHCNSQTSYIGQTKQIVIDKSIPSSVSQNTLTANHSKYHSASFISPQKKCESLLSNQVDTDGRFANEKTQAFNFNVDSQTETINKSTSCNKSNQYVLNSTCVYEETMMTPQLVSHVDKMINAEARVVKVIESRNDSELNDNASDSVSVSSRLSYDSRNSFDSGNSNVTLKAYRVHKPTQTNTCVESVSDRIKRRIDEVKGVSHVLTNEKSDSKRSLSRDSVNSYDIQSSSQPSSVVADNSVVKSCELFNGCIDEDMKSVISERDSGIFSCGYTKKDVSIQSQTRRSCDDDLGGGTELVIDGVER